MALVTNDQRLRRTGHGGTLPNGRAIACWHLATGEAAAVVETTGYFNAFVAALGVGDVITASLALDATAVGKNYIVTANDGLAVTIAVFV